ncbi:ATP-dependent protease ClpP, protease subunit [Faunimonas pinastri]|uniref:ATP-dependent Clp protease proteolytic subunit n=1 Tax=Faunimonas pinastri TaxID=1855383 RepID=A0A1H9QA91_9HYPH|nr:head maturation protease, ClpP-related [Faunimonas pinastri]SER57328.1 ATP-dependent protease ClpP, protease subunit [Faunimonas pinastri]
MAASLKNGELTLTGDVGDFLFGDGFTHGDVVEALGQVDEAAPLTVYLNSGGGYASEGAAIHALLSRRAGTTNIVVDGVAASAASLIAMAGDTVTMSAGSVLMIHDPSGFTAGTADDHNKTVEALEALATSYARVYAAKCGKTEDECRAIMKAERWYSPDEAVAEGFADGTSDDKAKPVAAFDYRAYAQAPQRLKALASKKNWRLQDAKHQAAASASASPRQRREHSMTDPTTAEATATLEKAKLDAGKDAVARYKARRDSVMAMEEAKGREALAEALVDSDMPEDQIKAMLAKAPAGAPTTRTSEFEARMRANGNPNVGADAPEAAAEAAKPRTIDSQAIFAKRQAAVDAARARKH